MGWRAGRYRFFSIVYELSFDKKRYRSSLEVTTVTIEKRKSTLTVDCNKFPMKTITLSYIETQCTAQTLTYKRFKTFFLIIYETQNYRLKLKFSVHLTPVLVLKSDWSRFCVLHTFKSVLKMCHYKLGKTNVRVKVGSRLVETIRVVASPSRVSCRSKISYGHDDFRAFILSNHRVTGTIETRVASYTRRYRKSSAFFKTLFPNTMAMDVSFSSNTDFSYRIRIGNRDNRRRSIGSRRYGKSCPSGCYRN